jgi:HAMP domain-containing protein
MNPKHTTIDVRVQSCHMQLHLPIFFTASTLDNIRKVFKLMNIEPWRNEKTCEQLRQFLPEWEQALKEQLARAESDLPIAQSDAEVKQQILTAFYPDIDKQIARAKRQLDNAKNRKAERTPEGLERHRKEVDSAAAILEQTAKPKREYQNAATEVKRLAQVIKTSKTAIERCGKVKNAYTTILGN